MSLKTAREKIWFWWIVDFKKFQTWCQRDSKPDFIREKRNINQAEDSDKGCE
jgi:hypothetical protein